MSHGYTKKITLWKTREEHGDEGGDGGGELGRPWLCWQHCGGGIPWMILADAMCLHLTLREELQTGGGVQPLLAKW